MKNASFIVIRSKRMNATGFRTEKQGKMLEQLLSDGKEILFFNRFNFPYLYFSGSYKAAKKALSPARKNNKHRFFLIRWIITIKLQVQYAGFRVAFIKNKHKNLTGIVWNGFTSTRSVFVCAAKKESVPVIFFENGPMKDSFSIDRKGINYNNSLPRDIEFYHQWHKKNISKEKKIWRELANKIQPRAVQELRDLKQEPITEEIKKEKFIFFPMQILSDTQLSVFGGWASNKKTIFSALEKSASALPNGWHLRIKEHPSAQKSFVQELKNDSGNIIIDSVSNSIELARHAQIVLTVNSSLGFEAMLLEKPVINMGQAFYGFADLTVYAQSEDELMRLFRSPELVSFNAHSRNCFLNYIIATNFFPKYEDILSGAWKLTDI